MVTIEQAKALQYRDILILDQGSAHITRWRVNGAVKSWKRTPEKFRVPLKHGLYNFGYLDETNAYQFTLEKEYIK